MSELTVRLEAIAEDVCRTYQYDAIHQAIDYIEELEAKLRGKVVKIQTLQAYIEEIDRIREL